MTAIHASSEEVAAWIGNNNSGKIDGRDNGNVEENHALQSIEATSSNNNSGTNTLINFKPLRGCTGKDRYTFICECFFMTARVLNLGLMKALSDYKHLAQV